MAWEEMRPMDLRMQFIADYLQQSLNMSQPALRNWSTDRAKSGCNTNSSSIQKSGIFKSGRARPKPLL